MCIEKVLKVDGGERTELGRDCGSRDEEVDVNKLGLDVLKVKVERDILDIVLVNESLSLGIPTPVSTILKPLI